jgi:hypothetical protein
MNEAFTSRAGQGYAVWNGLPDASNHAEPETLRRAEPHLIDRDRPSEERITASMHDTE